MMTLSKPRIGNFTSSEIVALTKNGKAKDSIGAPFYTYVEECNMERALGRALESEVNSRPTSWGSHIETRVFDLLGLEYQLVSSESVVHPEYKFWAGSPDANKFEEIGNTVVDIKSPITLKSFCQLVNPLYFSEGKDGIWIMNKIRETHKEGEKYYWQLISNAILTNSKYAELIVYAPYESELLEIQESAAPSIGPKNANWIYYADHEELPYLIDGGFYKNINKIRFEVPQNDKNFLEERVIIASKLLK